MADVFISYAAEDIQLADQVCRWLESWGMHCWIYPRDTQVGVHWQQAIAVAVKQCRVVVVIFTAHANASESVLWEIKQAIEVDSALFVFKVEDIQPSPDLMQLLRDAQWLDATSPPLNSHLGGLATAVSRRLLIFPQRPTPYPTASRPPAHAVVPDNAAWKPDVEYQLMQAQVVVAEGKNFKNFIQPGHMDRLAALAEELNQALQTIDRSRVEKLASQLQNELDRLRWLFELGAARRLSQNPVITSHAPPNLVEQLKQEIKNSDTTHQVQDMAGFEVAVQNLRQTLSEIINATAAPSGLVGGGGFTPPQPLPTPMLSGQPTAKPSPEVPGMVDRVHFSVTAPPSIPPGSAFVVDIWAHLEEQRRKVMQRARAAVGGRDFVIKSKGPLPVARGTVLTVHLKIEGLLIEDPQDTILWEGKIGNASFAVRVPRDATSGLHLGLAEIYANAAPVAHINFELLVAAQPAEAQLLQFQEKRFRTAFASYASPDRDLVLRCVQGMEKAAPFLNIFMDVHSLRSGQKWEEELWQRIPASDVFFLFWSSNARQSTWVEKEWRCAFDARGIGFIDPVPLESPDIAPPPPELAGLHFNDWELAYQRGQRQNRS